MRNAVGHQIFQRSRLTAERGDDGAGSGHLQRDLAADAARRTGDDRMRGIRQFHHARFSPNESPRVRIYFILQALANKSGKSRTVRGRGDGRLT
jgi:hypothetical protein